MDRKELIRRLQENIEQKRANSETEQVKPRRAPGTGKENRASQKKTKIAGGRRHSGILKEVPELKAHLALEPGQRPEDVSRALAERIARSEWYLSHAFKLLGISGHANPEQHKENVIGIGKRHFETMFKTLAAHPQGYATRVFDFRNKAIHEAVNSLAFLRD